MKFPRFFTVPITSLRAAFFAALFTCLSVTAGAQQFEDSVKQIILDPESSDEGEVGANNPGDFIYRWQQEYGGGPSVRDLRKVSPSALNKLKGDKSFWYIDVAPDSAKQQEEPEKEKEKESTQKNTRASERSASESSAGSGGLSMFVWLLIIVGFGGLVIWYLGNSNVKLFQRNRKMKNTDEAEIDEVTEDIFKIPYQRELDKAIAAGNYRLAVRLLYLRLLKQLTDKGKIRYREESTNADYLAQLFKTQLYSDFFRVTRHYEYSWYGLFPVSEQVFTTIRHEFEKLEAKI